MTLTFKIRPLNKVAHKVYNLEKNALFAILYVSIALETFESKYV